MSTASTLAAGTMVAGKLRVVRVLGAGGMGEVYEVEHDLTKHRRALKLLHSHLILPHVVERFLREASAAARIGNPHIVDTFDAGALDNGAHYLVMELLRGETLAERIARGPLPLAELADLVGQACEGVHAAHEAGIIHRDLKPENLYLTERDGRPFVKVLDFGISKFDVGRTGQHALTQDGAIMGTPYYMSPEQVRGDSKADRRVDVYALGVILYECASGRHPFEADALSQLAILIHEGRCVPLRELAPHLPAAFCDVTAMAMATRPDFRFDSAAALAHALREAVFAGVGPAVAQSRRGGMTALTPPGDAEPLGTSPSVLAASVERGVSPVTPATSQVMTLSRADVASAAPAGPPSRLAWLLVALAGVAVVGVVGAALGFAGLSSSPPPTLEQSALGAVAEGASPSARVAAPEPSTVAATPPGGVAVAVPAGQASGAPPGGGAASAAALPSARPPRAVPRPQASAAPIRLERENPFQ